MENTTDTNEKPEASFIDQKSIRNFAGASSALTILLNVTMLVYDQIQPAGMSPALLAWLAVFLCLAYSLSFLKRAGNSTITEYIWLTVLNSAVLFSSLTGINNMLEKAGETMARKDTAQVATVLHIKAGYLAKANTLEATFGIGDLKNIIFPKQAWFSPAPVTTAEAKILQQQASQLSSEAIKSVDQTDKSLSKVISTQAVFYKKTDSISSALGDLRTKYIETLTQLGVYQATITDLDQKLRVCSGGSVKSPIPQTTLQNEIETVKSKQSDQQRQQYLQQQAEEGRKKQQAIQQQQILGEQKRVQLFKSSIERQQQKLN